MKPDIIGEIVPVTWLVLTAYAPLRIAPAANYLRYGPAGVPRFGPNASDQAPHPHQIRLDMLIKRAGGKILFEQAGILLNDSQPAAPFDLDGTNIWTGKFAEGHWRMTWVWDFYRIYSGLRVEAEVPDEEDINGSWMQIHQALRDIRPGDQIIFDVKSLSGNLFQVYPVDDPPQVKVTEDG